MPRKERVSYFYDGDVGSVYYGRNHPMKPHRICMAHHLVLAYGLHDHLQVFRPHKAYPVEMAQFHTTEYIEFLHTITPEMQEQFKDQLATHNIGEDCPVFHNLFEFCRIYSGGTIDAAQRLNQGLSDIAINWSGGLHHAKKNEASGFCYVNDLVLGILELLKYFPRVLYIDIDVHHGDGVEEAFYLTDRVMTVSFHKFGENYFPGTGQVRDIGTRKGKYYSVNVPLKDGIDDQKFLQLFKDVISKVMEVFRPGAIVLQCGADSLACDRLGVFNLSISGHSQCVEFVKGFNVPLLVTGGGGYTKQNVARCWTVETGVLVDVDLPNAIPPNDYYNYYKPEGTLHIPPRDLLVNRNSQAYLSHIRSQVMENLRQLTHAPSVQLKHRPPDHYFAELDEALLNPDVRIHDYIKDKQTVHPAEFYGPET